MQKSGQGNSAGQAWLLLIALCTAALWLVVLPRAARTKIIEERAAWLAEKGIQPAAFNYADHPASNEMLPRLDRLQHLYADPFPLGRSQDVSRP
jgi:hypothetical protein